MTQQHVLVFPDGPEVPNDEDDMLVLVSGGPKGDKGDPGTPGAPGTPGPEPDLVDLTILFENGLI